jgi:chromate transport protein ChrA
MEPTVDEALVPAAQPDEYAAVTYSQIIKNFVLMGWTAFGGPQAHIALFETVRL